MLLVERAPASMRYWWSIVPLCQVLSLILTALTWGRWQAELSRDNLGSHSPYLDKILRTHGCGHYSSMQPRSFSFSGQCECSDAILSTSEAIAFPRRILTSFFIHFHLE